MRRAILTLPALAAVALAIALAAPAQEPELGKIEFPTSGSREAQTHFLRGVLYLHSFEYGDAANAFRRAQEVDPDFAMAYWGEAMTYTHPLWNQQDAGAAREVLGRLGATPDARRAKAPTPREKAYLDAVEILYGEGTKAERDTAYSFAMREIVEAHADDPEAKAFYALSLLGLSQGVRDVATYMRAAAVADRVFRANPRHPGAAHYLIHSFDDPVHAPLGLPAARAYTTIAPDAPHAQHMTTHIFVALGMWDEVVSQNEIAAGDRWTPGHYTFWLEYGLLQQGRHRDARALLERVKDNMSSAPGHRSHLADMRAHYLVNTRGWDEPVAGWEIDTDGLWGTARARTLFVAGYGALERGERAAAERASAELARIAPPGGDSPDELVPAILAKELRAALLLREGDAEGAIALLREAAAHEDAMPFEFGPPVVVQPSHELLGAVLLEQGRAEEAQQAFERALRLAPRRALSLLGLGRAAVAAGDRKTAARAYETLREVWHRADADLPGLAEARRFASVRE